MKHVCVKFLIIVLFILNHLFVFSEGFAAGTLVKTAAGYIAIDNLCVGDFVVCFDKQQNIIEKPIIFIAKKTTSYYARVCIGEDCLTIAHNQKIYRPEEDSWFFVSCLKKNDVIGLNPSVVESLEWVNESIDIYWISVAEYHNFFVTTSDICVHNFVPAIVLGMSILFGSGAIEIGGMTLGLTGLGAYLGYQWHKYKQDDFSMGLTFAHDDNLISEYGVEYNDAQVPGKPTEDDGYYPPKNWDGKKVKNPNGPGYGWPDKKGRIWIPTGPNGHGAPHWDVENSDGSYENVMPGGRIRGKNGSIK